LAVSITDPGDSLSASTSVALTVTAPNPPTITAPASGSLSENGSLAFSTAGGNAISIADSSAGSSGDSLTLSVAHGTLTLASTSGLTFTSGTNGSGSMTVTGTVANLNAALNGLTYVPTSGYSGSDSLAVSVLDPGDSLSASGSVALTVNPVTAPVITAPQAASLNENSSQVFSVAGGNAISFTDAKAGTSNTESLTLSVTHGTLKLATTHGLTFKSGANKSASMTVTGTVANLNAALNGITYKPTTGYSGSDSLAISVTDPGDGLSASTKVALTVNTLSPAFKAPATASVAQNGSLVFSTTNSNPISVTDVNAGTAIEQLTLTATNGKLKLGSTFGITFVSGANKSASMTISGTLANLNHALKNLTFTPTTGYNGSASIALSYTDAGNSLTASANIAITVGTGAAVSVGGSATQPARAAMTSPASPGSGGDEATASDTQWSGFMAAMELLVS
jgi:hypothetical protein